MQRHWGPIHVSKDTLGGLETDDFGLVLHGDMLKLYTHHIQPHLRQAPEVILEGRWSYHADMWSLGVTASIRSRASFTLMTPGTSQLSSSPP